MQVSGDGRVMVLQNGPIRRRITPMPCWVCPPLQFPTCGDFERENSVSLLILSFCYFGNRGLETFVHLSSVQILTATKTHLPARLRKPIYFTYYHLEEKSRYSYILIIKIL